MGGVIARRFTKLRPDQATLAGLTHNIGVLPILAFVEEHTDLVQDSITLKRIIDGLEGSLGSLILQSWDFPEEVTMVPAHYTDFDRYVANVDLVDVVMVANLQTLANSDHPHAKMDWSDIRAFSNVGVTPDADCESLAECRDDVVAAARELAA